MESKPNSTNDLNLLTQTTICRCEDSAVKHNDLRSRIVLFSALSQPLCILIANTLFVNVALSRDVG